MGLKGTKLRALKAPSRRANRKPGTWETGDACRCSLVARKLERSHHGTAMPVSGQRRASGHGATRPPSTEPWAVLALQHEAT
jgi:hypothetical protein